ncbi:MAG: hypothetical protein AAGA91_06395 [Pseudomonadota bacterium]
MRICATLMLVCFASGCYHPLEIEGEGDILSASGDRNCLLEDSLSGAENCTDNGVATQYQETYYAQPRAGWQFDRWENYCEDAAEAACSFDIPESAVAQVAGGRVPALRAVFVREDGPNKACNGGYCIISVLPGIEIEAAGSDIQNLANGDFAITGDAQILTQEGSVVLGQADLLAQPGVGMTGTSISPDYALGRLAGAPAEIAPGRVDIATSLGTEVDFEVPVYADRYYVVFTRQGLAEPLSDIRIGNLLFPLPTGTNDWRLLLDPLDPFIYVAVDQSLPTPTVGWSIGPDVTSLGSGYGVSLTGSIPYAPSVPPAIQEVLPVVQGDSVVYGSVDLALWVAFFELRLEGIIITDEDPDENGAYLFGASEHVSRDRIRATTGTLTPNYTIPLLYNFSYDLEGEALNEDALPFTLVTSLTGVGTEDERSEVWLSFDMPTLGAVDDAARGWLTMPGERAASVWYFGPEEDDNFLRFATETAVEIDAASMAAVHGVAASELLLRQTVTEINASGISLTSEASIESFHPDVTFTASEFSRLFVPLSGNDEFDLLVTGRSEIGGISLRSYGKHLTEESFRHWGEYVTPNYGYRLEGEFSNEGAWLEGSATTSLPYQYAAVEQILDIAGQIAAMEEAERIAEADYTANLARLREYQLLLEQESDALEDERAALRTAEDWLEDRRNELDNVRNTDCGSCKWYQAVCLAEVAACLTWREGAVPVLEGAVSIAQGGVNLAQSGVNRLQRSYDEAALLVEGAQRAVDLALDARNDARDALLVLRAERNALPTEDGVVDAQVSLRLTRGGLTGTVSGTFQGVPFGDGVVLNDAAGSRACFIVPQTGEQLCTEL